MMKNRVSNQYILLMCHASVSLIVGLQRDVSVIPAIFEKKNVHPRQTLKNKLFR